MILSLITIIIIVLVLSIITVILILTLFPSKVSLLRNKAYSSPSALEYVYALPYCKYFTSLNYYQIVCNALMYLNAHDYHDGGNFLDLFFTIFTVFLF